MQALIDEYRFDLVILRRTTPRGWRMVYAASAVRWIQRVPELAGGDAGREQYRICAVEEDDYDSRFLRCVELVRERWASRDNRDETAQRRGIK